MLEIDVTAVCSIIFLAGTPYGMEKGFVYLCAIGVAVIGAGLMAMAIPFNYARHGFARGVFWVFSGVGALGFILGIPYALFASVGVLFS